jgi:hypothetical protein
LPLAPDSSPDRARWLSVGYASLRAQPYGIAHHKKQCRTGRRPLGSNGSTANPDTDAPLSHRIHDERFFSPQIFLAPASNRTSPEGIVQFDPFWDIAGR